MNHSELVLFQFLNSDYKRKSRPLLGYYQAFSKTQRKEKRNLMMRIFQRMKSRCGNFFLQSEQRLWLALTLWVAFLPETLELPHIAMNGNLMTQRNMNLIWRILSNKRPWREQRQAFWEKKLTKMNGEWILMFNWWANGNRVFMNTKV